MHVSFHNSSLLTANSSNEAPSLDRTEERDERFRITLMPLANSYKPDTLTSTTERDKAVKHYPHSNLSVKPLLKQLSEKLKNKFYSSKDFKNKSKSPVNHLEPKAYTTTTDQPQHSESISNETFSKTQGVSSVEHDSLNEDIARLDKVYHHDSASSIIEPDASLSDIIHPEILPAKKPTMQETMDLISPNPANMRLEPPISDALQPQHIDPALTYRHPIGADAILPDIPLRKVYRPDVIYREVMASTTINSDYIQSNAMHSITPQEKYMHVVRPNINPPNQLQSARNFNRIKYFRTPQEQGRMNSMAYKPLTTSTTESQKYFEPNNRTHLNFNSYKQPKLYHAAKKFYSGRHVTNLREQSMALKKYPNPYLNILKVPELKVEVRRSFQDPEENLKAVYMQQMIDFNQLMGQMGSKVSRQLGRSIEDNRQYIQNTTRKGLWWTIFGEYLLNVLLFLSDVDVVVET